MHLGVAAGSDVGRMRSGNEDSYYADANEYRGIFTVADGMGGHAAGEVASAMTVEIVAQQLAELNDLDRPDAPKQVERALQAANLAVFQRTMVEFEKLGMGSTASVLVLSDTKFIIGHVGDSRIYIFRDGYLRQITKDHSIVQEKVDAGLLTPEQARRHPESNVITRCIGIGEHVDVDVITGIAKPDDVFLLASDGLTGMIEDRRLEQLLQTRIAPARLVDVLIKEANAHGGIDNITAVIVHVVPDDAPLPRSTVHE